MGEGPGKQDASRKPGPMTMDEARNNESHHAHTEIHVKAKDAHVPLIRHKSSIFKLLQTNINRWATTSNANNLNTAPAAKPITLHNFRNAQDSQSDSDEKSGEKVASPQAYE